MRDYASIKTARRVRNHLLRSHQTSTPQSSSMSYPYCRVPNLISNSISKTSRRSLQTTSFPLLQSLNTSPDYTQHGTYKQLWQNNNENKKLKSSITCISYNVLSQIQLDKHGFVYADVKDETCKNWSHRKQLLEAQFEKFIKNDDVDIFCLQEVDDDQVICFYQPFFEKFGYDILYQRKTTGSKRDPSPPDGLALVYKNDRFELQMKEKVKYLYEYQSTNIPSLKLSYPNIGLVAKFLCKTTNQTVILATTHLTFNPHRGEVKLAQLALLMSRLQELVEIHNSPVVITGDMNSAPRGELISKFLATGKFKYLEKRTSEISGQLAYHSNLKTVPSPPLPKELGIDYRDCSIWCEVKERDQEELKEQHKAKEDELKDLARKGQFIPNTLELSRDPMGDELVSPFDLGVVGYIGHKFSLYSPYLKKQFLEDKQKKFSTFFEKEKLQVDHIFVSKNMRVNQFLTLPDAITENRPSLLCRDFPSDHYPIGVNFNLPGTVVTEE